MFWWVYAIIWLASFALVYFLMPKPQTAPPPGLGEVKVPTAEEGREIPVLFGTRIIQGPNVVWWGDVKTRPHKVSQGKK